MNISQIKQEASQRLREDSGNFSKLILIHSSITAGVSLLLTLIGWLFPYITPDGGLSNLETQVMFSTVHTMLQLIVMLAVPFWDAGLIFSSLRLIRRKTNTFSALTEGFYRIGPILVAQIIQALITLVISVGCSFLCGFVLSFLPLPEFIYQDLTAYMQSADLPFGKGVWIFLGLYFVLYCIGLCVLLIPKLYLYRLATYRIMDDEPCGGLRAMLDSRFLMKGQRRQLFMLDLSFWWFYLLSMGVTALSMGDLFLTGLGVTFAGSDWIFPIAALLAQVALYWWAKPKLMACHALFYQKLWDERPEKPEPPKFPWMPQRPDSDT